MSGKYALTRFTCWEMFFPATPEDVAAQARRLIPRANIGLAPHDTTLVNIETVMWVDAPGEQALPVIHMFGHEVLVHLTFSQVTWNFGDGAATTRGDPGKRYDSAHAPCRTKQCPGYFGHEYLHTGRRAVTATASWTATFTVDGAGQQAIPGAIPGPGATSAIVVKQARAVLVPNPGEH